MFVDAVLGQGANRCSDAEYHPDPCWVDYISCLHTSLADKDHGVGTAQLLGRLSGRGRGVETQDERLRLRLVELPLNGGQTHSAMSEQHTDFRYESLPEIPKEYRRVNWTLIEVHEKPFSDAVEAFNELRICPWVICG